MLQLSTSYQDNHSSFKTPSPPPENGPGSRGSRPARVRLSDLGAMRHCTQPFLEHVRCCPRSCVVVASTYSQSVL